MSPLTFKVLPRIRMQPQIASTWLHQGLKYNLDLTAENKTSYIPCTLSCVDTYLPRVGKLVQDF